jgi:glycerophosphoryl diester phosphodiesterase
MSMLDRVFNLQGHRGARGLKPGNTLPSFETALDIGVTSIEMDLHLSQDGHVIVAHDPTVQGPSGRRLISTLQRDELKEYSAATERDRDRFPLQESSPTPLAAAFAGQHLDGDPFALLTLDELYGFMTAYAGKLGRDVGKKAEQRTRAGQVVIDLELKRVSGRPERIGDAFNGTKLGLMERQVLECVHRHAAVERTVVRSFDHRSVLTLKLHEPRLQTAVIIANAAPVAPQELVCRAGASIYGVDVNFLDELQVRQLHEASIAVIPWTVNDPVDWNRLLTWGVDGICTDYPDQLAALLRQRGIRF